MTKRKALRIAAGYSLFALSTITLTLVRDVMVLLEEVYITDLLPYLIMRGILITALGACALQIWKDYHPDGKHGRGWYL